MYLSSFPESVSYEFSHFMGLSLWFVYQFLLVIILMNILIAMMTTTFTKILDTADIQWKYRKSFYQVEFLHSKTILPIPLRYIHSKQIKKNFQAFNFRIFYYFASVRRLISNGCSVSEDERERDMEDQKNYKDTILKLLESKMFADCDKNEHDDFMKDLQNFIREEIKALKI